MNNTSGIVLKSIGELIKSELKFVVPSYQRGYRWTKRQVEELLDDIWEFSQKNKNDNSFYCLQPIVIKKIEENKYELIDGQQRLTTIYLLLSYFKNNKIGDWNKAKEFSIQYMTRDGSENFLKTIKKDISKDEYEKNIDFYCMYKNYEKIENWFNEKEDINISKVNLKKSILEKVKFIWYEIKTENPDFDQENSIENFIRLNVGKIPLTNAELIKALFLLKIDNHDKQIQLATKWDEIEQTLQNDAFWYFIYDKENEKFAKRNYETKIDYIFDLRKISKNTNKIYDDYYTFNEFVKDINNQKRVEDIWDDINKDFMILQEWYNDKKFFHYIGFLVANKDNVAEIINKFQQNKTKTLFLNELKKSIYKKIFKCKDRENKIDDVIRELSYEENKDKIKKILLLFNILTLLTNDTADSKFPFYKYKIEKWDIEHVHPQTEISLIRNRGEWAKVHLEYYAGINLDDKKRLNDSEIDQYIDKNVIDDNVKEVCKYLLDLIRLYDDNKKTDEILKKVQEKFYEIHKNKIRDEHINSISNLVLLDSSTNRAYKNSFFPVKRTYIIEKIKKGEFVPICTQNVFLKAYSKKFDDIMFWTEDDAQSYLEAIINACKDFFGNKE